MDEARGRDAIRAWKPSIDGIREVLHARFAAHAYPPHTHDVWTLFIVDEGSIRYDLRGVPGGAGRLMAYVLPPYVVHDGRTADGGYRKRVVYLETSILGEHLVGAAVDRQVLPDPSFRDLVSALDDALACPDDTLEAETRLHFVAEGIREMLGERPRTADAAPPPGHDVAEAIRAHLDGDLFGAPSIAAAARAAGVQPTAAARAFRGTFGIAPHAYVLGRRLEAARARILAGQPLADVAAETGFYDQAHLTRRFRRFLGTTPGRFARAG